MEEKLPYYANGKICYIELPAIIEAVIANGASILQQPDMNASEIVATFTDPAGNVL